MGELSIHEGKSEIYKNSQMWRWIFKAIYLI